MRKWSDVKNWEFLCGSIVPLWWIHISSEASPASSWSEMVGGSTIDLLLSLRIPVPLQLALYWESAALIYLRARANVFLSVTLDFCCLLPPAGWAFLPGRAHPPASIEPSCWLASFPPVSPAVACAVPWWKPWKGRVWGCLLMQCLCNEAPWPAAALVQARPGKCHLIWCLLCNCITFMGGPGREVGREDRTDQPIYLPCGEPEF